MEILSQVLTIHLMSYTYELYTYCVRSIFSIQVGVLSKFLMKTIELHYQKLPFFHLNNT